MIVSRSKYKRVLQYILLLMLAAMLLFPIVLITANSFMDENEVISTYGMSGSDGTALDKDYAKIVFIPGKASLMQYYYALLREPTFLVMFWNSVILTAPIMLGQILVSSFGGYAFAKYRFPLRDQIFFLFIIVMLMPYQVTLVPNYILFNKINMIGSYLAIILPGVFTTFGVFLLRQFIQGIPDEYSQAARVDGAGHLSIFFRVIMPQCKSGIASLAILSFVDNWNMVEQPLIFLRDSYKYPMSIFLSFINTSNPGIAFACGILYMLPAVLIFLYGEEYLIKGIQLSGIK